MSLYPITPNNNQVIVTSKTGDITKNDLNEALQKKYGKEMLQSMLDDLLLEKRYSVSAEDVDKELDTIKNTFGSEEEFKSVLLTNGYLDESELRIDIKKQLLSNQAVLDGVDISESSLKEFYDANKDKVTTYVLKQIVVKDEETGKEVLSKLKDGQKFDALVTEYSTDSETKEDGGLLPPSLPSDLPFDASVYKLKDGEVMQKTIPSYQGVHILQMVERDTPTFDESKPIVKELYSQGNARDLYEVLDELRKEENVKYKDNQYKPEN